MYNLDLNSPPPNVPLTALDRWLSLFFFVGTPIYSGNTDNINFNIFSDVSNNEVSYGKIFGNNITTTNFTFSTTAWFLAPKTGWYTFNINVKSNSSAAALMLVNYTDAYCCTNVKNNAISQQFQVSSIPSLPAAENPSDKVYLFRNFKYNMLMSYIHLAGDASLDISYTDPDGYYGDINTNVYQMNSNNFSEVVTCNYDVASFTTTTPWTGTGTTTMYQQLYRVQPNNFVAIQNWDIIGIPFTSSFIPSSSTELISEEPSSLTISSSEDSSLLSYTVSICSKAGPDETDASSCETGEVLYSSIRSSSLPPTVVSIPNENDTNSTLNNVSGIASTTSYDVSHSVTSNLMVPSDTRSIYVSSTDTGLTSLSSDCPESMEGSLCVSGITIEELSNITKVTVSSSNPSVKFDGDSSTMFPVTDYSYRAEYGNSTNVNTKTSESIVDGRSNTYNSAINDKDSEITIKSNPTSSSNYSPSTITSSSMLDSVTYFSDPKDDVYVTIITTTVTHIFENVFVDPINVQMSAENARKTAASTYVYTTTSTICPKCTVHTDSRLVGIILPYNLASVENDYYSLSISLVLPTSTMTDAFATSINTAYLEGISAQVSAIVSSPSSVTGSSRLPTISTFIPNLNDAPQIVPALFYIPLSLVVSTILLFLNI
ncbi:hypothetical protein C6P45_002191 [Maudiozyma exigua]|uniref:PA14 domain-containing protein n=1 Tax=Maudiozyma exigua TaxID=34358 RepID=A0A9P6VZN4_MAUEX|nr:hypothetical protein C6P45_002191 [Kazachstania exigua]